MNTDKPASPIELLRCGEILAQIAKDLQIEFQVRGEQMTRPEAVKHFDQRISLCVAQEMVVDKAKKIAGVL